MRVELQLMARFQIGFYVIVLPILFHYLGAYNMLYYWLVPAILGFIPINFVRNAEHSDCEMSQHGLNNTRSTNSYAWVEYLMWNMNYHAEHHLYPAIPWYNLPKLREHLKAHLKNITPNDGIKDGFTQLNQRMYGEWIEAQLQQMPRGNEKARLNAEMVDVVGGEDKKKD